MTTADIESDMTYFHASKNYLEEGSVIAAVDSSQRNHLAFFDNRTIEANRGNPDFEARFHAEHVFEAIRKSYFPDRPSRKDSLFASINLEDAKRWVKSGKAREGCHIYPVYPTRDTLIFVADLCWYNYAIRVFKGLLSDSVFGKETPRLTAKLAAREYWAGRSFVAPQERLSEVLLLGKVKIGKLAT